MTVSEQALVAEALQLAWNSFVGDTGCIPDAFSIQGGRANTQVTADFALGNFARMVEQNIFANRDVVLKAINAERTADPECETCEGTNCTYDEDGGSYDCDDCAPTYRFPEEEREAVYRKQTHPTEPPEAIERWLS